MRDTATITAYGTKHVMPWSTFDAARKASFTTARGVVLFLHPAYNEWMHVLASAATRPEHQVEARFKLLDGKVFDVSDAQLTAVRS